MKEEIKYIALEVIKFFGQRLVYDKKNESLYSQRSLSEKVLIADKDGWKIPDRISKKELIKATCYIMRDYDRNYKDDGYSDYENWANIYFNFHSCNIIPNIDFTNYAEVINKYLIDIRLC